METLGGNHDLVEQLEVIAESPINCESRRRKLESNRVSSSRRALKRNKILTLTLATKASFHELPINLNFIHSLKSGVGNGEWGDVILLLSGVERHRCAKSSKISNTERRDG